MAAGRHSMFVRAGLLAAGTFILGWLTLAITIAGVFRDDRPQIALKWLSFDAHASARAAHFMLEDAKDARVRQRARDFAHAALRRDPTNVVAVRTLALLALVEGDRERAARLFEYAVTLSRRDVATQLWLIDAAAARNDIPGALRHYDIALRTSYAAAVQLYPVLISAAEDPAIARPLNTLLRQKPVWWRPFVAQLAEKSQSPDSIAIAIRDLLDPADDYEKELIQKILGRFIRDREFDLAWEIYQNARARPEHYTSLVINGEFERTSEFPPLDWELSRDADLYAERVPQGDAEDDFKLQLNAANGRGGEVAKQLLRLRPGRHRLSAEVGNVPEDNLSKPHIAIACADEEGQGIAAFDFPEAGSAGVRMSKDFTVPASGCDAQWISLNMRGVVDGSPSPPWIDSLSVQAIQ